MNIILFGFMGTGKSAVAQVLARRLDLEWVDMDQRIEERQGLSIAEIFDTKGEVFFRQLERELVKELVSQEGLVVSTGGGVVLNPQNFQDLEKWGLCICLNASLQSLFDRTRLLTRPDVRRGGPGRQDRPLLKAPDPMKKIQELLELRQPYYQKIPHQIDTTHKSIHDVVQTILGLAQGYKPSKTLEG